MSIRGTITQIYPRWQRAAVGLLAEARGRTAAAVGVLRRISPAAIGEAVTTMPARVLRRFTGTAAGEGLATTTARRARRVESSAQGEAIATATPRRLRRVTASATAVANADGTAGARAQNILRLATGAPLYRADGVTTITIYR